MTADTRNVQPAQNANQSLLSFAKDHYKPRVVEIKGEGIDTAALVIPQGMTAKDISDFTNKHLAKPRRKTGTITVDTLDSFCEIVNTHKEKDSTVIYMSGNSGSMTAVINHHEGKADGQRFGDFRISFNPPTAKEWTAWKNSSNKQMDVPTFAEFVDDHITDITEPPAAGSDNEADIRMMDLAKLHSTTFADKAKVIELSRGLRIHTKDNIETTIDTQSGVMQLEFKSEHQTAAGEKLKVPGLFCIAIPVFDRGVVYRLPCRLKYRAPGGALSFIYTLVNDDKAKEHAINEMADKVKTATALPLYFGSAPSSVSV